MKEKKTKKVKKDKGEKKEKKEKKSKKSKKEKEGDNEAKQEDDEEYEHLSRSLNELESLCFKTKAAMRKKGQLELISDNQKEEIRTLCDDTINWLDDSDVTIDELKERFLNISEMVAKAQLTVPGKSPCQKQQKTGVQISNHPLDATSPSDSVVKELVPDKPSPKIVSKQTGKKLSTRNKRDTKDHNLKNIQKNLISSSNTSHGNDLPLNRLNKTKDSNIPNIEKSKRTSRSNPRGSPDTQVSFQVEEEIANSFPVVEEDHPSKDLSLKINEKRPMKKSSSGSWYERLWIFGVLITFMLKWMKKLPLIGRFF